MLKYSIKAHLPKSLNELDFDELYIANDLSYISGTADYYSDLINGETVSVVSSYIEGGTHAILNVSMVTRQGYILAYEKFPFHTLDNIDDNGNSIDYIEYNGSFYYCFKDNNFNGVLIDDVFYDRNYDNTITIPVKHWIEDSTVTIQGVQYNVDMNLVPNSNSPNGYESPTAKNVDTDELLEKVDGRSVEFHDYEYSKWKKCYHFIIRNQTPEVLDISSATTAMYFPFIQYSGETYPIQNISSVYEDENGVSSLTETYGALIGDNIYQIDYDDIVNQSGRVESIEDFNDGEIGVHTMTIDDNILQVNSILKSTDEGMYLILYSDWQLNNFVFDGDIIEAESYETHTEKLTETYNGTPIIYANGRQHPVQSNLCDYLTIDNENFIITYTDSDKTQGYISINDEKIYLKFSYDGNNKLAYHINKTYTKVDDNVDYTNQLVGYNVTEVSGVTIDGSNYPLIQTNRIFDDIPESAQTTYACEIPVSVKYNFVVIGSFGSNALLCRPYLTTNRIEIDNINVDKAIEINRNIINNFGNVHFRLKTTMFGNGYIDPMDYASEAFYSDHPFSSADVNDFKNSLKIYKITDYLTLPINLVTDTDSSLLMDDIITNDFINEKVESNINPFVDMEKDIYYPCYRELDGGKISYKPISKMVFNLHFRTRDLDSWKVIQDNTEDLGQITVNNKSYPTPYYTTSNNANWFITDYYDYKTQLIDEDFCNKLQMSSDLIGLLNFNEDDVKYAKSKISKSFLRLSFYSTPNPHTQMLMATSTIFMDSKSLQQKYLKNTTTSNCLFKNVENNYSSAITSSYTINVLSEVYDASHDKILLNEDNRLSSQISVQNKYETDNSSESFYLYLFKEYSTKLRENTLYMKVDFCHAGTGMVIPFILPTSLNNNEAPLYLTNPDDLFELKQGIPLTDLYDHLYIPIKVIYDENTKRYYYYLPDNFISNESLGEDDKSIMMFNLFELKLKNQSIE